ncbi:MAG: hypothetical protein AAF291_13935 [Pseudomonadota bacterium]
MTIKRLPGNETDLLRAALAGIDGMLKPYGLASEYSIDVEDNSYTVDVHAVGLAFDETWMRLKLYDELCSILNEIVFASDEQARMIAIQRAGCLLDSGRLRVID